MCLLHNHLKKQNNNLFTSGKYNLVNISNFFKLQIKNHFIFKKKKKTFVYKIHVILFFFFFLNIIIMYYKIDITCILYSTEHILSVFCIENLFDVMFSVVICFYFFFFL